MPSSIRHPDLVPVDHHRYALLDMKLRNMSHGNSLAPVLTTRDYLESIQRDSEAFAKAVDGNWTAPVEKCPGWSVADLVWHLRGVHYFWAAIVADRLGLARFDRSP